MKKIWSYVIAAAFCAVVAVLYMIVTDVFHQADVSVFYKEMSNAFFLPGFLMALFGGLVFCTNQGALDMLAFGFIKLFDLFKKPSQVKYRTYYDYKESKKGKKRPVASLLIVGLVFIVLSVPFWVMYYQVQK